MLETRQAEVYTVGRINALIVILNWKVSAAGPDPGLETGYTIANIEQNQGGDAQKGTRAVYFAPDGYRETPVYDRYRLTPGTRITGPAIIEERESTCLITPGYQATVDTAFNVIAELEG